MKEVVHSRTGLNPTKIFLDTKFENSPDDSDPNFIIPFMTAASEYEDEIIFCILPIGDGYGSLTIEELAKEYFIQLGARAFT